MIYRYFAFGLCIESEIPLPELMVTDNNIPDVRICFGEVPERLLAPIDESPYHQASAGEFLLRLGDMCAFYVSQGKKIVVQPGEAEDYRIWKLFLLGTSMGVLLMQRGMAPLHGSTVMVDGQGILLTGVAGAGKSTLAAAFVKQGYDLVADDVSALARDANGDFWVQPGYPHQKLAADSAARVGIDTTGLEKIFDREKFVVPVANRFCRHPVRLSAIYSIDTTLNANISIEPVTGVAKMVLLMENTYRIEYIKGLGLQKSHFEQCAALAKQVPVYLLNRPENLENHVNKVEALLGHWRVL